MEVPLAHLFGRSLRARLVLIFALVLVPPVLIAWGKAGYDYVQEREGLERLLLQRAKLAANERATILLGARDLLGTLAELDEVGAASPERCSDRLRSALARNSEYQSLLVLDRTGSIICSNLPFDASLRFDDRAWFRAPLDGQSFFVSEPLYSRLTRGQVVVAAVPLRAKSGAVIGVVAAGIAWSKLVARPNNVGEGRDSSITAFVDRRGELLPAPGDADAARDEVKSDLAVALTAQSIEALTAEGRLLTGRKRIWAAVPLAPGTIYVAIGQRLEDLNQQLNLKLLIGLALPALIWVAAVGTAWTTANRLIVHWVLRVRELGAAIAAGRSVDLDRRLGEAPQEIQELAASLTRMMETIQARNAELRDALDHRETLIREIHHRVKNNLQIIASLVNLQMRGVRDDRAREAMMTVRSRVNALALIHRSLYETDELQRIELNSFLRALMDQVAEFLDAKRRHIEVAVDVAPVSVPAETAVTLALLVTEALSNAFKHAFPAEGGGMVRISMAVEKDGPPTLIIADDGVGAARAAGREEGDEDREGNLGHQLMLGYARQLGGTLTVEAGQGTTIRIELPELFRLRAGVANFMPAAGAGRPASPAAG